jgi:hypothetical protein
MEIVVERPLEAFQHVDHLRKPAASSASPAKTERCRCGR